MDLLTFLKLYSKSSKYLKTGKFGLVGAICQGNFVRVRSFSFFSLRSACLSRVISCAFPYITAGPTLYLPYRPVCVHVINEGPLKALAGCGMGHKIEAGCGIREMLKAGYGVKISWQDRDVFTSIGAGCGIVLKLIAGCGI